MSLPELTWLAEQAQNYYQVVEVGSWMGRTTRALADNCPGVVYAVDTWEGSVENQEFLKDKTPNYLYEQFMNNLAGTKVIPMRMPSVEAAESFTRADVKLGMVFIDGSHDYNDVHADILAWWPLIQPGGLICGHDYDLGWPGVVLAVQQLIAPVPNQAAGGSSIWYQFQ
jgi:predicted O-methyltransferase YrrM